MEDTPVLDPAVLATMRESVGGDTAFVIDLVEAYLADAMTQLDEMDRAIGAADAAALVRPAHTLKSSSLTVGATRMAGIARSLEQLARAGTLDHADALAQEAHAEWPPLDAALRAWIAAQNPE